ncbi:MAG: FAD-binding protein [Dongiaceae bacterium]
MSSQKNGRLQASDPASTLAVDVLVVGGGPAATWSAVAAARHGAKVILVDKGYVGTSGATAPSSTGTWFATTAEARGALVARRVARAYGLGNPSRMHDVIETATRHIAILADWDYPFPEDDAGQRYLANLRGPDYMRFMRRQVLSAGVRIFDHHPAIELLADGDAIVGASGIARQKGDMPWQIRAGAVVLATGGCAFGSRILGATGLTGDGYLMAAEAGATFSGMEFSAQYGLAPFSSSLNKGIVYQWGTFYREDGSNIAITDEMYASVARAMLEGPVFACLDRAPPVVQDALRRGQPHCFLPFDRSGIDPFTQHYPVVLRCEGTVRGTGGIKADSDCSVGIPGLYAAGDTLDRQDLAGATTGGGGPNASWAISTGVWSGAAAASYALSLGRKVTDRHARPLGRVGLRPAAAVKTDISAADLLAAVKAELLPVDRNFFRTDASLTRSLASLNDAWIAIRDHVSGLDGNLLRSREAAAMLATARLSFKAALGRPETRGMNRRLDYPQMTPDGGRRIDVSGLDDIALVTEKRLPEHIAS